MLSEDKEFQDDMAKMDAMIKETRERHERQMATAKSTLEEHARHHEKEMAASEARLRALRGETKSPAQESQKRT